MRPLEIPEERLRIVNREVPDRHDPAQATVYSTAGAVAFAVGQLYQGFSDAVLSPEKPVPGWYPSFDTAVRFWVRREKRREAI